MKKGIGLLPDCWSLYFVYRLCFEQHLRMDMQHHNVCVCNAVGKRL